MLENTKNTEAVTTIHGHRCVCVCCIYFTIDLFSLKGSMSELPALLHLHVGAVIKDNKDYLGMGTAVSSQSILKTETLPSDTNGQVASTVWVQGKGVLQVLGRRELDGMRLYHKV